MRIKLLIISFFVSAVCFGQTVTKIDNVGVLKQGDTNQYITTNDSLVQTKRVNKKLSSADSLLIPVFSTKDVMDYLYRIEKVAASIKNLRLPNDQEYEQLTAELNAIIKEMDKKRKSIK